MLVELIFIGTVRYNVGMSIKIIKLEHSGVAIEKDGKIVVFDPVEFTKKLPRLENVAAMIITHKHSDHLQPEVIARITNDNPGVKIFTTNDAVGAISNATAVKAGDHHEIGGFTLDFFGKDHSAIVPGQVPCENIGAVVNGSIVDPGDSFDLPNMRPRLLFVPIAAPWLKIAESMEFIDRAKPEMVVPVHDALLSELGETISNNWIKMACDGVNAKYAELRSGNSVDIA